MKSIILFSRCLLVLAFFLCADRVGAQDIKDAFVLVDCSQTMNQSGINNEAKQIISDVLTGRYSSQSWEDKGWRSVSEAGNFFTHHNQPMVRDGGIICLIPFGNKDRVRDYAIERCVDDNSIIQFVDSHFPKRFRDTATFINVANAYVFHVAVNNGISGSPVYMLFYSDGMGDKMKENDYPPDLQKVLDKYGADSMSMHRVKLGALRKRTPQRHYDIEVWQLGIPKDTTVVKDDDTTGKRLPPKKLAIINPKDGISKAAPISWKKDEKHTVSWKYQNGSAGVKIYRKEGKDYKLLRGNKKSDVYKESVSGSRADIVFFESGEYKLVVSDRLSSDYRFISVSYFPVLPILFIIMLVMGAVLVVRYFRNKPKRNDHE